ncbi:DUF5667 domain-containing protein [Nocardioides pacificus]
MTPAWTARRRADEFDALVEDRSTSGLDSARYAELLEVVGAVRSLPRPEPRPDFSASLRERLMAEADTALLPHDRQVEDRLALPVRDRSRRDRRLAAAAGAFVLVGATSSMAVASQGALPGETLYPIKRAIEEVRTDITLDDTAKAHALLDNASDRLREATELAAHGGRGPDSVPDTLDDFNAQASQGSSILLEQYTESGDEQHIDDLRDFTATSMSSLALLEAALPDEAGEALHAAAENVQQIDAQAVAACPTCGEGLVAIPQGLYDAGPVLSDQDDAPAPTAPSQQARPTKSTPSIGIPDLTPGALPPGSLSDPTQAPSPGGAPTQGPTTSGPLTTIVGGDDDPAENPLGALLSPVTKAVDELTSGLGIDLGPLLGLGKTQPTKPPSDPLIAPKEDTDGPLG